MTVQELAEGTQYRERARYNTSENPFTFRWPPVPAHKFLAERDRAFDPSTPTSVIALDISADARHRRIRRRRLRCSRAI